MPEPACLEVKSRPQSCFLHQLGVYHLVFQETDLDQTEGRRFPKAIVVWANRLIVSYKMRIVH